MEWKVPSQGMLASRNSRRLSLANRRVLELAQTDVLTGLPNRAFFLSRLDEMNNQLGVRGLPFSILMLDLDRFKNVNDSLGHGAGDALLRQVAQRLKSALRATDVLARLGGDEFAIIQEAGADQRACATELAARIAKLLTEPFLLPGHRVEIGTSIGIAIAPDHGSDQEQLLKKADLALYRSKSAGRNCFTIYDEAMSAELEARNTLEGDLRDAIARCQLEVHYQPFVDALSGARCGFEALVRWRHPTRGLIPPDQFIQLAEETGLIVPLGEFVLRRACADAAGWPSDLSVAVNLSPIQFKEAELFEMIGAALADSGLPPQRLEIEITESVLLERGSENHAFMRSWRGNCQHYRRRAADGGITARQTHARHLNARYRLSAGVRSPSSPHVSRLRPVTEGHVCSRRRLRRSVRCRLFASRNGSCRR